MKKKKIFVGALIAAFSCAMLVGCGKKNTNKNDDVVDTTSNGSSDTSTSTSASTSNTSDTSTSTKGNTDEEGVVYNNYSLSTGVLKVGMKDKKIESISLFSNNYQLFVPEYVGNKISFVKQYTFDINSENFYKEIELGNICEKLSFYYDGDDFVFAENNNKNLNDFGVPYAVSDDVLNSGNLNRIIFKKDGTIEEKLTTQDIKANPWSFDVDDNLITLNRKYYNRSIEYNFTDPFNVTTTYLSDDTISSKIEATLDDGELTLALDDGRGSSSELVPVLKALAVLDSTSMKVSFTPSSVTATEYSGTKASFVTEYQFTNNRLSKKITANLDETNSITEYIYSETNNLLNDVKSYISTKAGEVSTLRHIYYKYDDKGIISEIEKVDEYDVKALYKILSYDNNYLPTLYQFKPNSSSSNYEYEIEYDDLYRFTDKKKYYYQQTGLDTFVKKLSEWDGYYYDEVGEYGNFVVAFSDGNTVVGGVKVIYFYDEKRQNMGVNVFTPSGTLNDIRWIENTYSKTEINGDITKSTSRSFSNGILLSEFVNINEYEGEDEDRVVKKNTQTTTYYEVDATSETGYKVTKTTSKITDLIGENEYKETYKENNILIYEETRKQQYFDDEPNKGFRDVESIHKEYEANGVDIKSEYKEIYTYNDVEDWSYSTTTKHYDYFDWYEDYLLTTITHENNINKIIESYDPPCEDIIEKKIIYRNPETLEIDTYDIAKYTYSENIVALDYYHCDSDGNISDKPYMAEINQYNGSLIINSSKYLYIDSLLDSEPFEQTIYTYNKDKELISKKTTTFDSTSDNLKIYIIVTKDIINDKESKIRRYEYYDSNKFENLKSVVEYNYEDSFKVYDYVVSSGIENYYTREITSTETTISEHSKQTSIDYETGKITAVRETYTENKIDGITVEVIARRYIFETYTNGLLTKHGELKEDADDNAYYDVDIEYTYDLDGKITRKVETDNINNIVREHNYQYTDDGNTVTDFYSYNDKLTYKYVRFYENGLLKTEETDRYSSSSWSSYCTSTYEYDENNKLAKLTENYGTYAYETIYTYDENGTLIKTVRYKVDSDENEYTTYYDEKGMIRIDDISKIYEDDVLIRIIKRVQQYEDFLGMRDTFGYTQEITNYTNGDITQVRTDYFTSTFNNPYDYTMTKKIIDSYVVIIDDVVMPGYTSHREINYIVVDEEVKANDATKYIYDENNILFEKSEINYEYETAKTYTETTKTYRYSNQECIFETTEVLNYEDNVVKSGTKVVKDYKAMTETNYTYNYETNKWDVVHN
ncbi:MAG: hypothetical protein K6E20_06285 [Acholeplasmatales bacterium]|nr:hypothetical protein [Acholeplasmatales bacterium]